MKISFTLLHFLSVCLNLSAAIIHPDTMKLSSADGQKISRPALQKDTRTSPTFTRYTDSLNLTTLVHAADSIRLSDSVNEFSHLRMLASIRSTDSLNAKILLQQIDTTKSKEYTHTLDSLKRQFKSMDVDTLKQQVKSPKNHLFKGPIYTEIASRYLDYDTLSNKRKRSSYQNEALNFTMQALHHYSMYNDTTGMRLSFDNLTKIYMAQKKYSQAKWFILQSNTLSRITNNVPNIITSLLTLSTIKSEIKDYNLAMRDLNEALQLSETNHYPKIELDVLKTYALLYSRLKNYPKEALVLKKRDSVEANIRKQEELKSIASVTAKDSLQRKKLDSLQNKKKVYTSNIKKLYKSSSTRKIASL